MTTSDKFALRQVTRLFALRRPPTGKAAIIATKELARTLVGVADDEAHIVRIIDNVLQEYEYFAVPAMIRQVARNTTRRTSRQPPTPEPRKALDQALHEQAELLGSPEVRGAARAWGTSPEAVIGSIGDTAAHWAKLDEREKSRRTVRSLLGEYAGDPAELCERLGVTLDTELDRRDRDTPCTNCRRVQMNEWIGAGGRVLGYACRACSVGEWIPGDLDIGAGKTAAEYHDEIRAALRRFADERVPGRSVPHPGPARETAPAVAAERAEAV